MQILLHNPNSNASLTDRLGAVASPLLLSGQTLKLSTASRGPDFIGSDATIEAARAQLYEELEAKAADCDAVVLGCFGDLGIGDLRRRIGKPVGSLWDAFFAVARLSRQRYGVVTTSEFWREKLQAEVSSRNLPTNALAIEIVSAAATASSDLLRNAAEAAVDKLSTNQDVDAVVLGGALLSALRPVPRCQLPTFDVVEAAIRLVALMAQ